MLGEMVDSGLWAPIFEGPNHFSILAQQPLSPRAYCFGGSFEKDIREWIDWAGPMLEFLASRLNGDCQIYMDDDEKEETKCSGQKVLLKGLSEGAN